MCLDVLFLAPAWSSINRLVTGRGGGGGGGGGRANEKMLNFKIKFFFLNFMKNNYHAYLMSMHN